MTDILKCHKEIPKVETAICPFPNCGRPLITVSCPVCNLNATAHTYERAFDFASEKAERVGLKA